ncbi:hypothetical protein AMTRI_Chr13g123670 [Amborella trichopoda]
MYCNCLGFAETEIKISDSFQDNYRKTLKRISRSGLRIYSNYQRIPRISDGMGVVILSTSRGIMTDREARREGIGGEILCFVVNKK